MFPGAALNNNKTKKTGRWDIYEDYKLQDYRQKVVKNILTATTPLQNFKLVYTCLFTLKKAKNLKERNVLLPLV